MTKKLENSVQETEISWQNVLEFMRKTGTRAVFTDNSMKLTKKAVYTAMKNGIPSKRKTFIGYIDTNTQTLYLNPDKN